MDRQMKEKEEDKVKRKANREAKKKENELKKLKEEVNETFVVNGKGNESRDLMLTQEFTEINGNNTS